MEPVKIEPDARKTGGVAMSIITKNKTKGERLLMMGNEAIARGALEAGVKVVAAQDGMEIDIDQYKT